MLTESGLKIQVKCRVIVGAGRPSETFSPFRSWDFDACVFVLFDSVTYDVIRAVEVSSQVIESLAYDTPWVAGKRMTVAQLGIAGVDGQDVTARIKAALAAIDQK